MSSFKQNVGDPLGHYFRGGQSASRAAQNRAWVERALPGLARCVRAAATLAARGDAGNALLIVREAVNLLKGAGYVPGPEDEPLFGLDWATDPPATLPEAEARYAALEPILGQILELAQATPRRLAWRRIAGWASLAVALAAVATLQLRKPENLALHKRVEASSAGFDTTPAGVVDGFRHGQLGFHSQEERAPWLVIDLGAPYRLQKVLAFGRADCCFDQSIPLHLEASVDGGSYRTLAVRKTPFSQFDPWQVELDGRPAARYLRFKIAKRGLLVLSEVEVYGN